MRRGLQQATTVVVLGDGAPWIWNRAATDFPDAVQIVDLYHAREHLALVGRLAFGSGSESGTAWIAARRDELDAGDVDVIVREIRQLSRRHPKVRQDLRKEADYFDTNKLRRLGSWPRQAHGGDAAVVNELPERSERHVEVPWWG